MMTNRNYEIRASRNVVSLSCATVAENAAIKDLAKVRLLTFGHLNKFTSPRNWHHLSAKKPEKIYIFVDI